MFAANYVFHAPHGPIFAQIEQKSIRRMFLWSPECGRPRPALMEEPLEAPQARELEIAIANYFKGGPESFSRLVLTLEGTEFQQRVWAEAITVAWGHTATYGTLCDRLGLAAGHARAVGTALGANPVHLLIPCHRFLGAKGALTGYAGGLGWKRALLVLEGSLLETGS